MVKCLQQRERKHWKVAANAHIVSVVLYALNTDDVRTVMYTCCRDGQYKQNTTPRATNSTRITKESRKLGKDSYCLARMTANENLQTGKVWLQYISTHSNHELSLAESKHLPLLNSVKEEVQEKFAKGISIERIMDGG